MKERYTDQPTPDLTFPTSTNPSSDNESIAGINRTFDFLEDQNDFNVSNNTEDPNQEDPTQTHPNESTEQLTTASHSPDSSFGNMSDHQDNPNINDLIDYLNQAPSPDPPEEEENNRSDEYLQGEYYTPDEFFPEN